MDIKFKYSNVYETHLNPDARPLTHTEIVTKIATMEAFWKEYYTNIENAYKEVTGLSFKRDSVICYVNSGKTFSDPLSLEIEDDKDMQDNLVHELIHILLTDNHSSFEAKQLELYKKFPEEVFTTKIHVIVHAIHLLVAQKLFPERVDRIVNYSVLRAYRKSWDIVKEMSAQAVVDSVFLNK